VGTSSTKPEVSLDNVSQRRQRKTRAAATANTRRKLVKFGYVALDKCERPPRQTSGVTRALVARAETIKCAPVGDAWPPQLLRPCADLIGGHMWPPDSKMVMPKVRSFVGSFGKLLSCSLLCLLVIKYLRLGCFAAPRLLRLGQLLPLRSPSVTSLRQARSSQHCAFLKRRSKINCTKLEKLRNP